MVLHWGHRKEVALLYDYLIQNARILDGSGADAFSGDVAVSGGSIAAVGDLSAAPAAHTDDHYSRANRLYAA